jgi:hypothetical protein
MAARSNTGKLRVRASEEIGNRNPTSCEHDLMWPQHRMKFIKAAMLNLRLRIRVTTPEHEEQFKVNITQASPVPPS